MADYGWTRVSQSANPDVVLLASNMTTTNIYYYYDWYYWDWWYTGWYPYWGWYYPYYPAYVTGYRTGSIFVQMIDRKGASGSDKVPVVWSMIINGLAEGSTSDIIVRSQNAVNSAFVQSPYLKH